MSANNGDPLADGFEATDGGGGATCSTCGSYVLQDERAVKIHRDWHRDLDRKTRPPTPAAVDRALGQHLG